MKKIEIVDIVNYILGNSVLDPNKQNFYGSLIIQFSNGELVLYRVESTHKPQKEKISYKYTPCYGTHGNQGKKIGECSLCHNPLYINSEESIVK